MAQTNEPDLMGYIIVTTVLTNISTTIGAGILAGVHCILMDKDVREMKKPLQVTGMALAGVQGAVILGGVSGTAGLIFASIGTSGGNHAVSEVNSMVISWTLFWGIAGALIGGVIGVRAGAMDGHRSYKIAEALADNIKLPIGTTGIDMVGGVSSVGVQWNSPEPEQRDIVGSTAPESDQGEIITN